MNEDMGEGRRGGEEKGVYSEREKRTSCLSLHLLLYPGDERGDEAWACDHHSRREGRALRKGCAHLCLAEKHGHCSFEGDRMEQGDVAAFLREGAERERETSGARLIKP